jgi:3-oxoacyl-[acyl-carrier-protein] synthase II
MTTEEPSSPVVITGIGAVTPIGIGIDEYWQGLLSGRCGIGPITSFDASEYPCRIAGEIHDFEPTRFFDRKKVRLMARGTQQGVAAALLALEHAGWNSRPGDGTLGVFAGISNSPQDTVETAVMSLRDHGYRRALPFQLNKSLPHAVASETGLMTGFQSNVMTFSTACSAGLTAIGAAVEEIRMGRADAILCTSTDSNIAKYAFGYFCRAGMLTCNNEDPTHASRPFDAKRDGGILAEGAACFLLEDLNHARRRGATPLAQILGFGSTGSGYSAEPEEKIHRGMAEAMIRAMQSANCGPGRIDYIGAHGVSDPHLDKWETAAIKTAFGDYAWHIPVSSVKSLIGIPQNAAGTLQLAAAVMAFQHDILPATMNYEFPDPECDLDYIPNHPRRNRINRALVFSHGFNGSDAAIIIGRAEDR